MHRTLTTLALAGALAATAAAPAAAAPTKQDRTNAAQECRAEQGTTSATREAFAQRYGSFGGCVSQRAHDEQQERRSARANAPRTCRIQRGDTKASREAFAAKYGTNGNGANAFGTCVSQVAREGERAADERDAQARVLRRNAARRCAMERGSTDASRAAFTQKYGTNGNGRNAFGRCVSRDLQGDPS